MELGHTEAIKQAVMAGLGVAFVSVHAARGELETGRLRRVPLRGLQITRHFHAIHNEARMLTIGGRAFVAALEAQDPGGRPPGSRRLPGSRRA
jgi:DNA-binding transcriptional LysR family regulator